VDGRTDVTVDVAIVGAGIAGAALAAVLARDGYEVLVLERQTTYRDKVRGEALACWGVAEVLALDLEKPLLDAGGHYVTRAVFYDETVEPAHAEDLATPLDGLVPGVPGVNEEVQLAPPWAGCQVAPPSIEISIAPTCPPTSVAVPVMLTGVPLGTEAPLAGAVMVEIGAVMSVDCVAPTRGPPAGRATPGCAPISARRLIVAC